MMLNCTWLDVVWYAVLCIVSRRGRYGTMQFPFSHRPLRETMRDKKRNLCLPHAGSSIVSRRGRYGIFLHHPLPETMRDKKGVCSSDSNSSRQFRWFWKRYFPSPNWLVILARSQVSSLEEDDTIQGFFFTSCPAETMRDKVADKKVKQLALPFLFI